MTGSPAPSSPVAWRVIFFVGTAEQTSDGWRVSGEDGLEPPTVGDRFTFVRPQLDAESECDLRGRRPARRGCASWGHPTGRFGPATSWVASEKARPPPVLRGG